MTSNQVAAQRQDRRQEPVIGLPPGSLFVGEVVDNIAHFGTVRVAGAMKPIMQGVPIAHLGNGIIGPRNIGAAYPAHTKVLCFHPVGSMFCYVLGAVPELTTSGKYNMIPDWIVPGSGVGLGTDRVHWGALSLTGGPAGDAPFASGRPCDELPGDHGFINELGVGYGIGRLMAWLRAGHFCGVEAFWADSLLRLTGYNLEVSTSASEMKAVDDEGEFNQVLRWNQYPWEARGVLKPSDDFTRQGSSDWQQPEAGREPINDDQVGLWRAQRIRGYVSDGERTFVAGVLPDSITAGSAEAASSRTVLPGLVDVGFTSRGRYAIRTAGGILLEKTVTIPIPKELLAPDDPTGDNASNYKAAGAQGSGPDHVVNDTAAEAEPGTRGLLTWERHALLFNHLANIGFAKHVKDWLLPEEQEALQAVKLSSAVYTPSKPLDPKAFWMPAPEHVDLDIDHRGKARYYTGRACIQLNDDGSIVLEDAFGSQIKMENGNIIIAPRNDVIMQPGRNAHMWAPNDVVLKAGGAVDVSASRGDVRIKAEKNMMIASSTRGVLIESKFNPAQHGDERPDWSGVGEEVESRGVLLRAGHSSVTALGKDVYVRSGTLPGTESTGVLHIDAGGGAGEAYIHGLEVTARCAQRFQTIVGSALSTDSTASLDFTRTEFLVGGRNLQHVTLGAAVVSMGHETLNSYTNVLGELFVSQNVLADGAGIFGKDLAANGSLLLQKNMQIGGSFLATGNIVARAIATDDNNGFVGTTSDDFKAKDQIPPEHPDYVKDQIDSAKTRSATALSDQRDADNALLLELTEELYGPDSAFASADVVNNATFSFRVPEQYGTDVDFTFYEARWQQHNRLLHGVTTVWDETSVDAVSVGRKTMPFPGYEVWTSNAVFGITNGSLFDVAGGTSIARGAIDSSSNLSAIDFVTFANGYSVTLQRKDQ